MSLFDDILKGLPVNSVLREKVAELEAKYAATETENAILRDDLREAKAKNQQLEKQIEELSHTDDLNDFNETDLKILVCISKVDRSHAVATVLHVNFFQDMSLERIKYHLTRLEEFGYIHGGIIGRLGTQYFVTQPGRKLLLDKNLL